MIFKFSFVETPTTTDENEVIATIEVDIDYDNEEDFYEFSKL